MHCHCVISKIVAYYAEAGRLGCGNVVPHLVPKIASFIKIYQNDDFPRF